MSLRASLAFLLTTAFLPAAVRAETAVLTIGGGPSPTYNQISLEKNVVFFEHILATLGGASSAQRHLFRRRRLPLPHRQIRNPAR